MAIPHMTLWVRWAKKVESLEGGEEPTKRKKTMHPEIKESLKLSDKGSYYKQEDFYSSTDESNEDTNLTVNRF